MKRDEAWKESMKRIEAGENRHRVERKALEHYEVLGKVHIPWLRSTTPTPAVQVMHYRAVDASNHLAALAGALSDCGLQAAAVEVRRFMFDVIEPHAGRQCQ